MISLKNKKVLVMGLKKSGFSAIRLLLREGASVVGTDSDPGLKPEPLSGPVAYKLGGHDEADFAAADLIVVSPGVSTEHPALVKSRAMGIPVIGEMELAASFLDSKKMYAITGTNGKSTTTALLGEMFKKGGKRTFVGGNIGIPATEAVLNPPPGGWEAVVLEVSSFQLETIQAFRPKIGAILNITPDHGERYAGPEDYAKAKFKLFQNQTEEDTALLNWDDPVIRKFPRQMKSRVVWFSQKESLSGGIILSGHSLLYRQDQEQEDEEQKLGDVNSAILKGSHNIENMAVACGIAFLAGIPHRTLQEALDEFKGLEHRLETVRVLRGVAYINDSKGTNVGAAVRSLENVPAPIVLIAGGKEKGGGFSSLAPLVREKVKALILIGEARGRMKNDLKGSAEIYEAGSLEEAVQKACSLSQKGDAVLLSPACSSYDMFKDYAERGEIFKKIVGELS
jgi:UDP-N-acetylmuramoylalanine--D-glutamate ligase